MRVNKTQRKHRGFYMKTLNRKKSRREGGRSHYNSQVTGTTVCKGYMWIGIEILLFELGLYRSLKDIKGVGS